MLIGSAIKLEETVYWLKFPNRHGNVFHEFFDIEQKFTKNKVMGFVTNDYEFLDRQEAAEYAFLSGQIKTRVSALMSEDLF